MQHDRVPAAFAELLAHRGWIRPEAPKDQGGARLGPIEGRLLVELHEHGYELLR